MTLKNTKKTTHNKDLMPFSVAMCVYGKDNPIWFEEAMDSIVKQTLLPDEVILVVDGPVPKEINEVIIKYDKLCNLEVYRFKKNMGHGIARSESIKNCKYDYIAICDADDISVINRFEKEINEFRINPKLSAVSSFYWDIYESKDNIVAEEKLPTDDISIKNMMKTRCPICQPAVMLKKKDVVEAGGYQDWFCNEDYFLWLRMMQRGAVFANIAEPLLYFRTSEEQLNRRGGWKYFKSNEAIFRYMWNKNIINLPLYIFNVSVRFVLQVIFPSQLRGLARKCINKIIK